MAIQSRLSELPEEILVQIISLLPQHSLLDIARVSPDFRRLASAELYSTVCYVEIPSSPDGCIRYSAQKALLWEESEPEEDIKPGRRHTRIFRLPPFLTTVRNSPYLRSLIATAALEQVRSGLCLTDTSATPDRKSITLDEELRSVGTLHLALGLYHDLEMPWNLGLKSLSLRHTHQGYDIDYLHAFFSIPTLRWLCISELLWSHPLLLKDDIDRSRTSDVKKLSFPSSAPSANDFAELLTWPKALVRFGMEAAPDSRQKQARRRRLLTLLGSQKETLEQLFLSGVPCHPLIDYRLNRDLTAFSALKRLSIRHDWLEQPICLPTILPTTADAGEPNSWDILPLGLEKLQLEISIVLDYSDIRWDRSVDETLLSARYQGLIASIFRIIRTKTTRQLSLEEIMVWYRKRGSQRSAASGDWRWSISDYEDRMCSYLVPKQQCETWRTLQTAFDEVGGKLGYTVSAEPPLVDI